MGFFAHARKSCVITSNEFIGSRYGESSSRERPSQGRTKKEADAQPYSAPQEVSAHSSGTELPSFETHAIGPARPSFEAKRRVGLVSSLHALNVRSNSRPRVSNNAESGPQLTTSIWARDPTRAGKVSIECLRDRLCQK